MHQTTSRAPFFAATDHPIVKVGLVVWDAVAAAKNYSQLFQLGPWAFCEFAPTVSTLRDEAVDEDSFRVRVATNTIGDKEIELVQPLGQPNPYRAFLDERGEGIHHLGFAATDDYDTLVASAAAHGLTIEMEAIYPGPRRLVHFGPWQELGIFLEYSDVPAPELTPWGRHNQPGTGWISMEEKRIAQIGIVTDDSERMARRYHELFGIGPWVLYDFKPPAGEARVLHDIPVEPGTDHLIKAAIADHTNLQFELLQPVIGPSTHLEYLLDKGPGAHHLSFDVVDDHDELVATMQDRGIGIEMAGLGGDAFLYTYLATRDELATFWEVVKFFPEEDVMAGAYGVYPPEGTEV